MISHWLTLKSFLDWEHIKIKLKKITAYVRHVENSNNIKKIPVTVTCWGSGRRVIVAVPIYSTSLKASPTWAFFPQISLCISSMKTWVSPTPSFSFIFHTNTLKNPLLLLVLLIQTTTINKFILKLCTLCLFSCLFVTLPIFRRIQPLNFGVLFYQSRPNSKSQLL